jgi:hypothetical protein
VKNDPLHILLARADSAAPVPLIAAGLAERIRRRAHRRQTQRHAAIVVGALCICGLAFSLSRRTRSDSAHPPLGPGQIAAIRTELTQLDAQAQTELREVAEMRRVQSLHPRPVIRFDDPGPPASIARVNAARDRTALILLLHADELAGSPETRIQAHDLYLRAARLFPMTPAGRTAAQRVTSHG